MGSHDFIDGDPSVGIDVVTLIRKGNIGGGTLGPQYLDGDPIVGKDVVTLIRKGNIGGGTLGPRVSTAFTYVESCCESHV